MSQPILQVKNLGVRFHGAGSSVEAVRGVSFTLGDEKLAIVGESGSGKSQTGRAIMRLSAASAEVTADQLVYQGRDLLGASEKEMCSIRGSEIAMIFQDPKFSLNPLMKVGQQVAEAYRAHMKISKKEARERALEMLESVHIRDVKRVYERLPHEISGGMGQRIMIAMMLIPEPDLIIADEPTTALDVSVRRQVLKVLDELVERTGARLIFISHDLNLVADFCDRVLVMYAGRVVEEIAARDLAHAKHPYTQGLLNSLPRLDQLDGELPVLKRDASWLND